MILTFAVLALALLYWFPLRRWMNRWGATQLDLARVMAGDGLLPTWTYSGTLAVVVRARTRLRETSFVCFPSSGYSPNCHTHSMPPPMRRISSTSARLGSTTATGQFGPWPMGIVSPAARC